MHLNPLQQKILSIIEPLSLQNALVKLTLIQISQIGLGATVTKILLRCDRVLAIAGIR